jgi:hypothetical protein
VLAIVGVVFAVLTVRVVTSARAELAEASRLERSGEIDFAIVHYRRAAGWYAPGNPYVADALAALARIGEAAEAQGDAPRALAAWRGIRGAILSTRSVYTPHQAPLAHANERIATVMASLDPPPMDAGKSPEELRAEHLALLRATHRPSVPWTLVLLAGFLTWVSGAWLFAMKGIDDEGRVRPRSARLWGSTVIVGLGLFVLGLALA